MILREKYLEMLEAQQLDAALCCLRNEFGNLLQVLYSERILL
jgi:hypothetical protein